MLTNASTLEYNFTAGVMHMLYKLIITLTLLVGLDQLTTNLDITNLLSLYGNINNIDINTKKCTIQAYGNTLFLNISDY